MHYSLLLAIAALFFTSCRNKTATGSAAANAEFPQQLTTFTPYSNNPVFTAAPGDAWDKKIRERGYILYEDSLYRMWYTGFKSDDNSDTKLLGYATSTDGINWKRHNSNPVFTEKWTEDMSVVHHQGKYYMFAEGVKDVAHHLVSDDGINWSEQGDLVIIKLNGDTIAGPYGTPTVYVENNKWYLFYERNDEAIWLATSEDKLNWKNVQDEPVLKPGPEKFDLGAVAANQVIKYNDRYYMFYHANADPMWNTKPTPWSSNIAVSDDLVHWKKFSGNPITEGDHSSPVTVFDGKRFRLYTMHPEAWMYYGSD